jgi:phytoene synthase
MTHQTPGTPILLPASYRLCNDLARQKAKNFYYGFMLLPRERRLAMSAMYAWFRACDDITDEAGTLPEQQQALEHWRQLTSRALLDGDVALHPIFPAFCDAVQKYRIPHQVFWDMLAGSQMDLEVQRYQTFEQLYRYCYCVASTVGLVCIHIFGFDGSRRAQQLAEWCGIAFQLTNILRDVEEDAGMGRTYLPRQDLERFGLSADELNAPTHADTFDARFKSLMRFEVERARSYYVQAEPLLAHIYPESRPAFSAMVDIYRSLLDKIESEDFRVYGRRVKLSKGQKLGLLARALWRGKGLRARALERC